MDIADIHRIRRQRLRELVDSSAFGGSTKALAARIQRSPAQVSQWLSGHRDISDESRDHIETHCGLPSGWINGDAWARPSGVAEPAAIYQLPAPWPFETLSREEWFALTATQRAMAEGRLIEAVAQIRQAQSKPKRSGRT